jgi:membrane associated rhomboid family serine protease
MRFALLFLIAGIFAALAQIAVEPQAALVGASGALAGVMAAFVRHYPNALLYIWGVLPIRAWVFALLWIFMNLAGAGGGQNTQIAFTAHLAGLAAGLVLSFILEPNQRRRRRSMWG